MSLILEALKKAERQHKLGEVPGISSHPGDQPGGGTGRMGWIMLGLFAVVMLLAGIYLGGGFHSAPRVQDPVPVVKHDRTPTGTSGAELTARPEHAREEMRDAQPVDPTVAEPVAADEIQSPKSVASDTPPSIIAAMPEPEPEPPPPTRPAPRPAPEPQPEAKLLNDMPAGFVANLPPMNIDIHSYDQRPEKRYVLINMQRYREGDYLSEGPRIISIRPNGVEMEHMGARFILPIGAP